MIRTYDEIQQVIRRIKQIVHKFIPDAEIEIVPTGWFYGHATLPDASSKRVKIELAQHLIETGTWEQIENVVAHEIAHILAADRHLADRYGWHTTEWKNITLALGGSGEKKDYYENTDYPARYKIRCAHCGYTVLGPDMWPRSAEASYGLEPRPRSSEVNEHIEKTGHNKWHFLDMVTGRRWTDSY
jgi:predicted SprT family Zn-dependent metalloprotease